MDFGSAAKMNSNKVIRKRRSYLWGRTEEHSVALENLADVRVQWWTAFWDLICQFLTLVGSGAGVGVQTWSPDSDAQGTCSYLANCLYEYSYIFTKKKKKNVHFISPYLLLRLFSVTSLWFTLKYVDDT